MRKLEAPFPWFGGKSRVASIVWERFGHVAHYVEPFFGSGAVLLGRPTPFHGLETINDKDGFVSNFWRAIKQAPDETAHHASHPVNENDLHARHAWLVAQRNELQSRLEGDPDYCDPKIAGWWAWGLSCWIASGFCPGTGPWQSKDGKLTRTGPSGNGISRQKIHLSNWGQGVCRKNLGALPYWFSQLSDRLRFVRVASGDWARVCTPAVVNSNVGAAPKGVFLDPPYSAKADRSKGCYAVEDLSVAHDVAQWAVEHGNDPTWRIALCGYDGEHDMPEDWDVLEWKAHGGYGSQGKGNSRGKANKHRERIWFSPHCLEPKQASLFG